MGLRVLSDHHAAPGGRSAGARRHEFDYVGVARDSTGPLEVFGGESSTAWGTLDELA